MSESRVARLHHRRGRGSGFSREAPVTRRQELLSLVVFLVLLAGLAGVLVLLLSAGVIAAGSEARIYLSFALGLALACAFVSALTVMIRLRHWLLPVITLSALAAAGAGAMGWVLAETVCKLGFAAAAGLWISLMLTSISQVLVIAALIIIVDIYSVFRGPTRMIVESGSRAIEYLTISLPAFGAPASQRIGISDFIFFAIFVGCALSFRLRRTGTAAAMTLSFIATMVISSRLEAGMPALPLLSLAFLAVNGDLLYRRFIEEPDERRRSR